MANMSNRERIARAAEEARLASAEKTVKKTSKKPATGRAKRGEAPQRMKVVWEVGRASGATVKTYPYAEKAAAEAAVLELTRSTGKPHLLRANKVPMGADE